jgi:hypothetical protein
LKALLVTPPAAGTVIAITAANPSNANSPRHARDE